MKKESSEYWLWLAVLNDFKRLEKRAKACTLYSFFSRVHRLCLHHYHLNMVASLLNYTYLVTNIVIYIKYRLY